MADEPGQGLGHLPKRQQTDALIRTAHVLVQLHNAPVSGLNPYRVRDELALLQGWHRLVSDLHPELLGLFAVLQKKVAKQLSRHAEESALRPIHRDFHDKQILISAKGTVLLDLDTLTLGDPALDVGNYLAHVDWLNATTHTASPIPAQPFLETVLHLTRLKAHRVEAWRQATLLRLAYLNLINPVHRNRIESLLEPLCA